MLDHVQLCGPVKSWKRAEDPSNGKPKGFGFCEFESAEGILRATRLLNKLSLDGQELVVCIIACLRSQPFFSRTRRRAAHHYIKKKRSKIYLHKRNHQ
jgi:RNA recognition motif-containing protein